MTMFSDQDMIEISRLFPPRPTGEDLPKFVSSLSGHGFVASQFTRAQFESRITKDTGRTTAQSLAGDLDVAVEVILELARGGNCLLGADGATIVPTDEGYRLSDKLRSLLDEGLLKRSEFSAQHNIDAQSTQVLLGGLREPAMEFDDQLCGRNYRDKISERIKQMLDEGVQTGQSVNPLGQGLPGSPPSWFVLHLLKDIVSTNSMYDDFEVRELPEFGVWCISGRETQKRRDKLVTGLASGDIPYTDLSRICGVIPPIFADYNEASHFLEDQGTIQIFDTFAVSNSWIRDTHETASQTLRENGRINLSQQIPSDLPKVVHESMVEWVDKSLHVSSIVQLLRVGDFLVTKDVYDHEREALTDYGHTQAASQWQQLKEDYDKEIKFSPIEVSALITDDQPLLGSMIKDKDVLKTVEDKFWTTILSEEVSNEEQFSEFWTERVLARSHLYNNGLDAVEDQKLRAQLAELLAAHLQKELLVDSISKGRSQGLVLSRKTRKNLSRFESILKDTNPDLSSILTAFEKFNKKQGIVISDTSKQENVKKTMITDMARRMQRQKPSDGPVLFLTLVLLLFAKAHSSVLYATGKFAPKLLKQLKTTLPTEQYEQLEKWKEAAKTSTLTAEDRAEMRNMADA